MSLFHSHFTQKQLCGYCLPTKSNEQNRIITNTELLSSVPARSKGNTAFLSASKPIRARAICHVMEIGYGLTEGWGTAHHPTSAAQNHKMRTWHRQYSTINPALSTEYCKNWAHFRVWGLLQEAEVSREVNLLFTYKRLFWTVLGTPCASTNTHSDKEPNSERDRRFMAVQKAFCSTWSMRSSFWKVWQLPQLEPAVLCWMFPMRWSFSREARVQRLGQSALPC